MSSRPKSETFREYTVAELIEKLHTHDSSEVVEVEVQDPEGNVIATELVQLNIGYGYDTDRSGGYRWLKITAQQERR